MIEQKASAQAGAFYCRYLVDLKYFAHNPFVCNNLQAHIACKLLIKSRLRLKYPRGEGGVPRTD
jgi:hypothetical protein